MNMGIQLIGEAQASIISSAEPVMSMLLAVLLLGESVIPIQWLGAGLIVTAVMMLQLRPARKTAVASKGDSLF
jgi:drug/metabolite transporter (DMT)-like permease